MEEAAEEEPSTPPMPKEPSADTHVEAEPPAEKPAKKPAPRLSLLPKDLELDVLLVEVEQLFNKLSAMQEFDNTDTLAIVKTYGRVYYDYRQWNKAVGDRLAQLNIGALSMRILRWMNGIGLFKNDEVWFPAYYTMNLCWNYSDASKELAKNLADAGMIEWIAANVGHEPYIENQSSKNVLYVLKCSLSMLQNIAKVPDTREIYEKYNIKKLLVPFMQSENEFFKATSTMVMTAIITEEENKLLEDNGSITYLVKCVKNALQTEKRRHRGFTPTELVECLGRMAVNDNNKLKLLDEGILPLLVKMMEHTDEEEQYAAAYTVWTLSFGKELHQRITGEANMVPALVTLRDSPNGSVAKMAKGSLWTLGVEQGGGQKAQESDVGPSSTDATLAPANHVFISYAWANQDMVVKIKDRLKRDGFRVWIDLEQMGGSTLEAMASAVEDAAVVLICTSEKYKLSPNARTEAEYTFQLKKPIIPLMLQRRYRADGWLGMLLGAKFYVNFDGKYEFEHAVQMLQKELADRGRSIADVSRPSAPGPPAPGQAGSMVDGAIVAQEVHFDTAPAPVPVPRRSTAAASWTSEQVHDWITKHQLESYKEYFANYDGRLLARLVTVKAEAPDFFYKSLKDELSLSMIDLVKIAEALEAVPR